MGVHVVAISRLHTPIEAEAAALAADLGTLPYEQRLKLAAGVPAVVLASPDEARANTIAGALSARGHEIVRCMAADVVATDDMVEPRTFRFDPDALVGSNPDARVPWDDIAVLMPAVHRTSETRTTAKRKEIALGRAVLTGELITRKTVAGTTVHDDVIERVLYVATRTGGRPWIVREQHVQYTALGNAGTSSTHNFLRLVDELRTRALRAVFDERLATRKETPAGLDLLAHLIVIAQSVTRV